ncbi:hypothetical protein EYC84_006429 [Monilinia fructicola]|uniref:Uncharacterized protein n=1 Tax=Monilinia fructicola TaxID=38448 RepID=A0A5M9K621_MONFR|nr:hypothetical protein EYC84_006429 [Monilinia fructicola]
MNDLLVDAVGPIVDQHFHTILLGKRRVFCPGGEVRFRPAQPHVEHVAHHRAVLGLDGVAVLEISTQVGGFALEEVEPVVGYDSSDRGPGQDVVFGVGRAEDAHVFRGEVLEERRAGCCA